MASKMHRTFPWFIDILKQEKTIEDVWTLFFLPKSKYTFNNKRHELQISILTLCMFYYTLLNRNGYHNGSINVKKIKGHAGLSVILLKKVNKGLILQYPLTTITMIGISIYIPTSRKLCLRAKFTI